LTGVLKKPIKNVIRLWEIIILSNTGAQSNKSGTSTAAVSLKVVEVIPYLRTMRTRMPFRFGNTVMTGMPVLHLRVWMEDAKGRSFEGWSACGLVSMWFDKDYSKPESKREADLLYSVAEAIHGFVAAGSGSSWQLHQAAEPGVRAKLAADGLNGLVSGYGVALLDAAIIDGVCRGAGVPFYEALKNGILGFEPEINSFLPPQPASHISLRHTIGLGDPLTKAEVKEPIDDGLPQTLEQVCSTYGARFFKIKVNNDITQSLDRLKNIAAVLDQHSQDYKVTLDGNEAFPDMDSFLEFVTACAGAAELQSLWGRTLWIEQPVARQQALEDSVSETLKKINVHKPVIVDESDDADKVLERAMQLGYSGISAKNCKGIYRTLSSFVTLKKSSRPDLVLSSEDLTNQPIVPNHQDLCVAAALGIAHSERNGHHFFRSFDFLPETERLQAIVDYPSLYQLTPDGIPSLRFQDGAMPMREINLSPGLGVSSAPEWSSMEPLLLPQSVP
jgi:hypothetical protein